jgi:hypothetical protein
VRFTVGHLLMLVMGNAIGFAVTQSAWSGDWSWALFAMAALCGGVAMGLRDRVR